MPKWNFTRESTHPAEGANGVAGLTAGFQPFPEADVLKSKRNVIVTNLGWVRRTKKGLGSNERIIDEVLVAANPGSGLSYGSNTHMFKPDVAQVYMKPDANGEFKVGVVQNVYVVFNTPLVFNGGASASDLRITIANTAGGNHQVALCEAGVANTIVDANNTLVFRFTPGEVGTYKVNAQVIMNVAGPNPLYNPDQGTGTVANLTITGAVVNAMGSFSVVAQS